MEVSTAAREAGKDVAEHAGGDGGGQLLLLAPLQGQLEQAGDKDDATYTDGTDKESGNKAKTKGNREYPVREHGS